MAKCPNCGREAARTIDWVCEWCGYPLPDGSFKKIDKTFRELKEERLSGQPLSDDIKTAPAPKTESAPVITPEALAKLRPQPAKKPEPTPTSVTKPEPMPPPAKRPEPGPPLAKKPEPPPPPAPEPVRSGKPASEVKIPPASRPPEPPAQPKPKAKPETVAEVKPQPKPQAAPEVKPEPAAARPETPVPEVKTELARADIEMTVADLLTAYETDGVAADAQFTNKILRITGVVDKINVKDALNIYSITLNSPKKSKLLQGVRCVFEKTYGNALNQLSSGQTVTVQGKYTGSMIDISVRDCSLVL